MARQKGTRGPKITNGLMADDKIMVRGGANRDGEFEGAVVDEPGKLGFRVNGRAMCFWYKDEDVTWKRIAK
jgi:hypothetical protein